MMPKPGDRVEMTGVMPNDPAPLEVGEQGTVTEVKEGQRQIYVEWDSGRRLILLTTDPFKVISKEKR